jgi:hypothetical protein
MKPFKRSGSMFVVEDTTDGKLTVELGVDFDRRPAVNHFRTTSRYYTSDHEYRIDGTSVFCRLMEDRHGGPGVSEYKDVRDGVVLESAIRERNRATPRDYFHGFNVDDEIDQVRREVEWHEMGPLFRERWEDSRLRIGLKYFILAKKLPRPDARRYLRQELERLTTRLNNRLKVAEGRAITDLEFSWKRKLTRVLEKLLAE